MAERSRVSRGWYSRIYTTWRERGLSRHAASVLALAGIERVETLRLLDRDAFKSRAGCGPKTLDELARVAGWPCTTVEDAIASALSLAIADHDECIEIATDVAISLRRAGYVVVAGSADSRHQPTGA